MEGFIISKTGPGIMVSLDISLSYKHDGKDSTNDKLKACKYIRST
jgi:hypothetical protein